MARQRIGPATSAMKFHCGVDASKGNLGSKVIHPYGDFLLHDVGTGDGIVQNGPQNTANKRGLSPTIAS
jgi:CxxC motif-containing protein (DUF1111 family)